MRSPIYAGALALALALAACSGGGSDEAGPTTTSTSTRSSSTTVVSVPTGPPAAAAPLPRPGEPLADGSHAAYLVALGEGEVTVDVIQLLGGDEADAAYAEETGDTGGVPNDYYIRNTTTEARTLPLREPAVTVAWDEAGPRQHAVDLDDLPAYLEARDDPTAPWWVTVRDGAVIRLDEQYRP